MSKQRSKSTGGRHQPTLLGLWKSGQDGGKQPKSNSSGAKRKRNSSHSPSPAAADAEVSAPPPICLGRSSQPRWENISLLNGPMLLLRGCIGGKKASERRFARETLASLPDWDGNVTFKIYGKECKMRRRISQYSTGGKISFSYSGLVRDMRCGYCSLFISYASIMLTYTAAAPFDASKKNIVAPEFPEILYNIKCQVEDLICDHILDITKEGAVPISKNLSIPPGFVELAKSIKSTDGKKEIYNYCLLNHYRNGEEYMGYHADDEGTLHRDTPIASVSFGITRHFDIRPRHKNTEGKKLRVARIALGDGDLLLMLPPMQSHYEHAIPVEKRITGERINLTFRRVM